METNTGIHFNNCLTWIPAFVPAFLKYFDEAGTYQLHLNGAPRIEIRGTFIDRPWGGILNRRPFIHGLKSVVFWFMDKQYHIVILSPKGEES